MKVCDKCKVEIKPWSLLYKNEECSPAYCIQIGAVYKGGLERIFDMELCSRCKRNIMQNIRRWLKRPYHKDEEVLK